MKSFDESDIDGYAGICRPWCMMFDSKAASDCAVKGGRPIVVEGIIII